MKMNETIAKVEAEIEQAATDLPSLKASPGYMLKLIEVATALRKYETEFNPEHAPVEFFDKTTRSLLLKVRQRGTTIEDTLRKLLEDDNA